MKRGLFAVLCVVAMWNSASAQQKAVTIHVLSGDSRLQRDGKWSPARLWRLDTGGLTVVADLGSHPVFGMSNRRLVVVSGLTTRVEDDLGGGKVQSRIAIRTWDLSASKLSSDQTLDSLPGTFLTGHHNRPSPVLSVVDAKSPIVYATMWSDQIIKPTAEEIAKNPKAKVTDGDARREKIWTLCAIDLHSGKSWALRGDADPYQIQGPIQIHQRIAFFAPGKSAWFYNPVEHSLGPPITLPPAAKEYSAGLGMLERRLEGDFLVTDVNFAPLDKARQLPNPVLQWPGRASILAGNRPLWILFKRDGDAGTEIILFDPEANKSLFTKRFDSTISKLNFQKSPSGMKWFIHNIETNKVQIIDVTSKLSTEQDLSSALKDLERPILLATFDE